MKLCLRGLKFYKFGIIGSSARKLRQGAANHLAGRAFVYNLYPLTHREIGAGFNLDQALAFGTLPKTVSSEDPAFKKKFLIAYTDTYLKEEILMEQIVRELPPFRRFLAVAAQSNTEPLNYSNIAKDVLTPLR